MRTRAPRKRSAAGEDRDDPQQLDVDPDDRHGQPEGRAPGLLLRKPGSDAALDEVEVHDQHQDADTEAEDAEDQARRTEAVEAEIRVEEAQHEVEERDRDEA